MALVDFTSYDDIRAALGVSEEEIGDTTLALPLYAFNLTAVLEEINLTLIATFTALPVDAAAWTPLQVRFDSAVRLFSTYAVARLLTISLPLFSPKEIGDGKAHTTRYAQDPYKSTIQGVLAEYEATRARLITVYAAVSSTTTSTTRFRNYFTAVPAGNDPVTGG